MRFSRSISPVAAATAVCLAAAFAPAATAATRGAPARGGTGQVVSAAPSRAAATAAARRGGRRVEITALRGERSETYADPDGSLTTVQHLRPVRTRRAGRWVRVDPTLRFTGGAVAPVATTTDLSFSAGGTGPFVRVARAGRRMSLSWPGVTLPRPALHGATATYRNVLPGVDLRLTAKPGGFSQLLVVHSAKAAHDPRLAKLAFHVTGTGLRVKRTSGGGLAAVDTHGGGTVLAAPRPMMWDSARPAGSRSAGAASSGIGDRAAVAPGDGPGAGAHVAAMDTRVHGRALTVRPDAHLLTGHGTHFPVYVDPVWYTPQDGKWAMLSSGYPSTSYYKFSGDEGVGYCDVSWQASCNRNQIKRLIYQFQTTRFAGKQILSATFVGYETQAYQCGTDHGVQLWRTAHFSSGVTWNSYSGNWLKWLETRNVSYCSRTSVEFGNAAVKAAVQQAADRHYGTITFGLKASSESSMATWKRFADDAYLRVQYNSPPDEPRMSQLSMSPGGACSSPSDAPAVNDYPTLYAVLHDPDGDHLYGQFRVGWTDSAGTTHSWTSAKLGAKASGGTFDITIPASVDLPQHTRLNWEARAYDGYQWSPWSYTGSPTSCYFSYDSSIPAPPSVASTDYPASNPDDPDDPWIDGVGRYGSFTFASTSTDVTRYQYRMNGGAVKTVKPASTGGPATVRLAPPRAGLNYLRVQAFDAAGNASAIDQYMFRVKAGRPPVAGWNLDEPNGATTVADGYGSHPATVTGGVTLGVDGVERTAMQLNGTDGHAATAGPVLDTTKSFSVSAWVKLPTLPASGAPVLVSQSGTAAPAFELYYSAHYNRWIFGRYAADASGAALTRAKSTSAPIAGHWAHLVGVYDAVAATITLYVNGVAQQSVPFTTPWNATGDLLIGAGWYGSLGGLLGGDLDDVRVFDRMITATEVQDLYTQRPQVAARWKLNDAGTVVPEPAAYYKLDEAAGATRAEDVEGAHPAGAHGGVTFGTAGRVGSAVTLNGTDGYLETSGPVLDTAASFSVSAWVRLPKDKPTSSAIIATQAGTRASGFQLYYSAYYDRWIFGRYASDTAGAALTRAQSDAPPDTGTWTQLTGVYDAAAKQLKLYVNGVLQQAVSFTTPWNATGDVQIGVGWYGHRSLYFPGDIDEVRLFGQALTGSQAAVMATGSSGDVTADDGPNGYHAQLFHDAHIDQGAGWVGTPPGGLVLNGVNDFASTDGTVLDTSQSFSVAGWVTTPGVPDHRVAVFAQDGYHNAGFELCYDPAADGGVGGYRIIMPSADSAGASRTVADDDEFQLAGSWDHVAIVYDAFAGEMRLYVDGQLEQTEDHVSWADDVVGFATHGDFQIGRALMDDSYGGQNWPGVIDDVWAFDGVLTQAQIQNLASGQEIPTVPGP